MKTIIILIIALFSHLTIASEWKHVNQNVQGYQIRLSYTSAWSPATYGSNGGSHEGIFYIDIYSRYPAVAETAEIFEIRRDGRLEKVSAVKLKEDTATHFYGKKNQAGTYAEYIWSGRNYRFRIFIDGKVLEGNFRI